jgi:hypothetical protein
MLNITQIFAEFSFVIVTEMMKNGMNWFSKFENWYEKIQNCDNVEIRPCRLSKGLEVPGVELQKKNLDRRFGVL